MKIERLYNQDASEYQCNVYEFISTNEGRELIRLENFDIRIAYPGDGQWYESLDRRERVDRYFNAFCADSCKELAK